MATLYRVLICLDENIFIDSEACEWTTFRAKGFTIADVGGAYVKYKGYLRRYMFAFVVVMTNMHWTGPSLFQSL